MASRRCCQGKHLEATNPGVYPEEMAKNPCRYFKASPEIIQLAC